MLIDLHTAEEKVIAETYGWEEQLGANLNWGQDDESLYYNNVDTTTWEPYCERINPLTGQKRRYPGGIYRISPDGRHILSASMERMRRTQRGYGVVIPDEYVARNEGFSREDGLYITDTGTEERKLLISIHDT